METGLSTSTDEVELDKGRQAQAREYARIKRRVSFIGLGLSAAGVLILLFSGLGIWLRDVLRLPTWLNWQPLNGWFPWQILAYFLLISLAYEIITLPLSYYSGYVLPHRYQLATMSRGAWMGDQLKGLLLGLVLEGLAIELIYALLAWQPLSWWLWVALVLIFFSVVMANLAPVLIMPLFYKFTPLPEGELSERLLALVNKAGTRVRGTYTMHLSAKTTAANAALMGLGNTRRIVVGDTMLDRYTNDEIEVVLAHELGHHVHRDIWKLLLGQSLLMLGGLYLANLAFHGVVEGLHAYEGLADPATLPFLLMLIGVFGLLIMPLSNGLSRAIEYQADEYALQATGKIEAFKSAMTRLANQNLAEVEPSPLVEFLFHSHPSIRKRLRHADEFARRA
ncbi:MAG TPA: M48 family metallopeptidase [Ktedonobacteraceae bacterium]|nr:M48 family metallopeptidase [Ktedonobacteraceae bacterium]